MNSTEPFTVIVVEDDIHASDALATLLLSADYCCRCFFSAEELLAQCPLCERCCLLLDIHLGLMNGLALQRELKKCAIQAPVIIVSGDNDPVYRQRALDQGALDFLAKPYDPDLLLARVADAMHTAGQYRARPGG